MIALSNRLPRSTRKPASASSGWSKGRITLLIVDLDAAAVFADGLAVDGGGVLMDQAGFISSLTTAGTPPAR
jgi:hypothetical protein